MSFLRTLIAISSFALFLSACKSDDGDPSTEDNAKDRQEILAHWADHIVKPSYANFKLKLDELKAKSEAFSAAPDGAKLAALRAAWIDAYTEWQKVELFEFGPADNYTLRNFFNIYPTNTTTIAGNINDPSVSLDVASSYASQGFPALDYMINGLGTTDDAIVTAYTSDPDAAKRTAYLTRLTARMNTLLDNVVNDWNGSYRDTFVSKTGLEIGSSFGNVVNAYVLQYERYVRSGKVGIPAGVFSSEVIQPERVEALYKKDISRALAITAHQAARDFFNGKSVVDGSEGPSFKSYLDALDAKDAASGTLLSTIINAQFTEVSTKLSGLDANFYQQVQDNNDPMIDAFTSMQKLVRLLKLDMTSAMSVTITYTDNDGD
jgi:predicted lipoprotein